MWNGITVESDLLAGSEYRMIRATLVYLFVGVYVILMAPPAMLWTGISGNSALIYSLARFCIRAAGWMCGVRVSVQGRDKISHGTTYVFLSNHQGNFDGPVLLYAVPRNWKALIKKEMMSLPVLSLTMRQVQFVPVERTNPKKARAAIDLGARLLKEGHSFIAFPEGTRSRDGRLGEFKKGAFIMAIKAQVSIIPVTIRNSARIQPPGDYRIHPGRIDVIFHDPIATQGMTIDSRDDLIRQTRNAIESALP